MALVYPKKSRMHLDIHRGIDPATTTLKEHPAAISKVVAELVEQGESEGEHLNEDTL